MISCIFTCKSRLPLTKMILMRFLDMMDYPFELILSYHGSDVDYVRELSGIYPFDYVSMKSTRGSAYNNALDHTTGDYIFHMENDWWWIDKGCVGAAIYGIDTYDDIDMIRLLSYPYHVPSQVSRILYMWPVIEMGSEAYGWHHNPSLRKEKFPLGRVPEEAVASYEGVMNKRWQNSNMGSWMFIDNFFQHVGMFDRSYRPEQGIRSISVDRVEELYDVPYYGSTINDLGFSKEFKGMFDEYLQIGWNKWKSQG